MLSVAKLTLGQEAYYEQQVARRTGRLLRRSGRVAGDLGGQRRRGARARRRRRGRRPRDAAARRQPGDREALRGAGAGADDHGPHARRRERRVAGGAEAARARLRLRPRLLVPEERQPAACADRRRGGAARDQRGARGGLAGRARLSRARGLRRASRPRRRGARARRGLRRRRVPAPHEPGAGPAPAHACDRRQHGPRRRRRVAGARRRGDPEDATGSPPATCTRRSSGTS